MVFFAGVVMFAMAWHEAKQAHGNQSIVSFTAILIILIHLIIVRYLVGVLMGGLIPFSLYPFVIAAPCLIFLPLSLFITDTPLWLIMQVIKLAVASGLVGLCCQNCCSFKRNSILDSILSYCTLKPYLPGSCGGGERGFVEAARPGMPSEDATEGRLRPSWQS